tara:strand:- start:43 stop:312 length:270 start_codon:yes stop_codon:yes gene_type:complete
MALTKKNITDKVEIVKYHNHYMVQVRELVQIFNNDDLISDTFYRYVLNPDVDASTISDPVVLAQFNAVMTKEVKDNYAKFLKEQEKASE